MSLRMRNTITTRRATNNQENVNDIGKAKTFATSQLQRRAALGEIGNVHTRQAANLTKDAAKKEEVIKKPLTVLKKPVWKPVDIKTTTSTRVGQNQSSQSLICKTSTLAKPLRAVAKPLPSAAGAAASSSIVSSSWFSVKPQPRPTLLKTAASSSSSLISKPSTFASVRVKVPVLPENSDIRDIDKESANNPLLLGEYAGEIYAYMREIEVKFSVEEGFLTGQEVTSKMRELVVDWLVDVQLQYNLLLETLHLATGIFDRFLQKYRTISRKKLQLVGVTAMWIASKYEELFAPEVENFVYITDRAYTKKEIMDMEQLMHKTLNFCYGQPLSIHFLRRYSKASEADPEHHACAKYFLELALVTYNLRHIRPSLLAAVALFIAFCVVGEEDPGPKMWSDCLVFYSTYTYVDIKPYIPVLTRTIIDAENSKLQAVRRKFSSSKHHKVSIAVYQRSEILEKLVKLHNTNVKKNNITSTNK
ncbi:cyclin B [Lycorma delicatula]|uniref:cyclin B n=1 Tax=Lycorma delicatula TaxID=130591 RepID=UPI003F51A156